MSNENQKIIQEHYNKLKKRLKTMSKSELITIIWKQGLDVKELQHISKILIEENKVLKGESSENDL